MYIKCMQGTCDCQVFQVLLLLSAFLIFDNLVSRKRMLAQQNRPAFGPRG